MLMERKSILGILIHNATKCCPLLVMCRVEYSPTLILINKHALGPSLSAFLFIGINSREYFTQHKLQQMALHGWITWFYQGVYGVT
jgi:hypothetical protein